METNQEFNQVIFTIDLDFEELIEHTKTPHLKTESSLEIFCILKAQELKEYFSEDSQEFCKNVFNPEFAEMCSNFKINKSSPEEYNEYLDMLDKIEESSAKADYRNMLKKIEQWVTKSF